MPKSLTQKHSSEALRALKDILQKGQYSSQQDIKIALEKNGYHLNQSKISRLLHKLGAIKTNSEHHKIIYSLPHEPAPPSSKKILSHLLTNITANETLIVIHTHPGSASLIARLLDHHRQELNILGTVAGDDTVFVSPLSMGHIKKTLIAIQHFLAGTHSG